MPGALKHARNFSALRSDLRKHSEWRAKQRSNLAPGVVPQENNVLDKASVKPSPSFIFAAKAAAAASSLSGGIPVASEIADFAPRRLNSVSLKSLAKGKKRKTTVCPSIISLRVPKSEEVPLSRSQLIDLDSACTRCSKGPPITLRRKTSRSSGSNLSTRIIGDLSPSTPTLFSDNRKFAQIPSSSLAIRSWWPSLFVVIAALETRSVIESVTVTTRQSVMACSLAPDSAAPGGGGSEEGPEQATRSGTKVPSRTAACRVTIEEAFQAEDQLATSDRLICQVGDAEALLMRDPAPTKRARLAGRPAPEKEGRREAIVCGLHSVSTRNGGFRRPREPAYISLILRSLWCPGPDSNQ